VYASSVACCFTPFLAACPVRFSGNAEDVDAMVNDYENQIGLALMASMVRRMSPEDTDIVVKVYPTKNDHKST